MAYASEGDHVRVKADGVSRLVHALCSFEVPKGTPLVWETLVETERDADGRFKEVWFRDAYPMFDWARRYEDGRWILGSRRGWSADPRSSTHPRDHAWLTSSGVRTKRTWQRSFVFGEEYALPKVVSNGHLFEVSGSGGEDAVTGLLSVDRVWRLLTHQPLAFPAVEALPEGESRRGILAHLALQSSLDDHLACDAKARGRT